jgi:hypothetical protein
MMNRVRLADGRTGTVIYQATNEVDVKIDGGGREIALPISEVTEIVEELDYNRQIKVAKRSEAVKIQRAVRAAGGIGGRIYRRKDGSGYTLMVGKGISSTRLDAIVADATKPLVLRPQRGQLNSRGNRSDGR